ncbi:unnamed protein product [Rotaria sp. Silwood1]|nr:unnamed protein product [Rotaria sp. Silwood1]CAF1381834.1 unnamed protein product [Rotaria sp. Silwood1]CAF3542954.1 unnamed protein product [Rotaria sp. Silwood1]CAF3600288.1 unnamed protein product [Rotaria sp. Silwood1]CAF4579660.1 unnamed protein product [Rotaria sp. Silwood1]
MPNTVFLVASFVGSLVLLWSSRIPRSILTVTNVDILVGSIVYCKIRWLFGRWGLNMPITCVCLASIDRFLMTSSNIHYHRFITLKRAYIIVTIFSIAYLAICIPDGIYYSGYLCTASANDRAIYKQFITYFNLIVTNILSLLVLIIFSLLTWYNFWSTRHQRRSRLQQQVNRMMLTEFTMVCITTLPNFVFNIYQQATQSVVKSQLRLAQENLWTNGSVAVSFTLHVGTFYIYIIVSRAYRRNVRTALCFKNQNQVTSLQSQLRNGTTAQAFRTITARP